MLRPYVYLKSTRPFKGTFGVLNPRPRRGEAGAKRRVRALQNDEGAHRWTPFVALSNSRATCPSASLPVV